MEFFLHRTPSAVAAFSSVAWRQRLHQRRFASRSMKVRSLSPFLRPHVNLDVFVCNKTFLDHVLSVFF